MGGGEGPPRRVSIVAFPVPLPPSFVASFSLPPVQTGSAPAFDSLAPLGEQPRWTGPPEGPQAKRRRVDKEEGPRAIAAIGAPGGEGGPSTRPSTGAPLSHRYESLGKQAEETPEPSLPQAPSPVTRLRRKLAWEQGGLPAKKDQQQPQQQHDQQQQSKTRKQQFAAAVALLQSLPIWRRHPDSIPAIEKAAAEAIAARERRRVPPEGPPKLDSMLDGGPFASATIHWEVKRQAVCVKAYWGEGPRSACRYFPLSRLSPEGESGATSSHLPQRKNSVGRPGPKVQLVCPRRLLFAAYVFFLQLPLSLGGGCFRRILRRQLANADEHSRPGGHPMAGGPRESKQGDAGEALRGPLGEGPESGGSKRLVVTPPPRERAAGGKAESSRTAAEALAAAAVAVGCLAASGANKQSRQQQQQQQQQLGGSIATVILLRWSFLLPERVAISGKEAENTVKLEQLIGRRLQKQQQQQQEQQQQLQQHVGSGVSVEGDEQLPLQREVAAALLYPQGAPGFNGVPIDAIYCRLCGYRTGESAVGLSLFAAHCLHLRRSHPFLSSLVALVLSLDPPHAAAAAAAAAAGGGASASVGAAGASSLSKPRMRDIALAIRRLRRETINRCGPAQHEQQQQQQRILTQGAFAAAATAAATRLQIQLEGLVLLSPELAAAERGRLLMAVFAGGPSASSQGIIGAEGGGPKPLPLTVSSGQQQQQPQPSPPAAAVRGETTLGRLLQEQETTLQRLLDAQLLQQPPRATCPPALQCRGPLRGPLALCDAAAPTEESAVFLLEHLRAAVDSKLLLPSVCDTIASARLWGPSGQRETPGVADVAGACSSRGVCCSCCGKAVGGPRQHPNGKARRLRHLLSEDCICCSRSAIGGSNSRSSSKRASGRALRRGREEVWASQASPSDAAGQAPPAVYRRLSWFEALCLMPQRLSSLPIEACVANSGAAAAGPHGAAQEANAVTAGCCRETLHLIALLLPPLGGASLKHDRHELLELETGGPFPHPYVFSLFKEKPQCLPQSISILTLSLPSANSVALQLRRFLTYRTKPLVLDVLVSGNPTAAATAEDATGAATVGPLAAAAIAASETFRRSMEFMEAAAEAICCTGGPPRASLAPSVCLLLQYLSGRIDCHHCDTDAVASPCARCAAALDAAAAAAAPQEAGGPSASLSPPTGLSCVGAPGAAGLTREETKKQQAADIHKKVFGFLAGALLGFLKAWEEQEETIALGSPDAAEPGGSGLHEEEWPLPAVAFQEEGEEGGLLADVLIPQASVQDECLAFGGFPRGCDDTQTGLLIQATPFVARVVRGVPLLSRHQVHQVTVFLEALGATGEGRDAAASAASSSSSSRRPNSGNSAAPAEPHSLFGSPPATVSFRTSSGAPSAGGALPIGAIECVRRGPSLASSLASLARAPEAGGLGARLRPSPAEEEPVSWKSVDLFAWSLLDENGAPPELSLQLRLSKPSSRRRSTPRASPAQSPVSLQPKTAVRGSAEPAAANVALTTPPAEEPQPSVSIDPDDPPLHGDSSSRVLAALWQAASCRVLDLAAGEAQRHRISPFCGLLMESVCSSFISFRVPDVTCVQESGCIPEAADLQLQRNELFSLFDALDRLKTAQIYETSCRAAQLAARQKHLRIAKSAVHGWGVFAAEAIRRGEFIVEYAGNAVSEAKANFLEALYVQSMGGSTYFFKLRDGSIVDATSCGAATRFINHSCAPNCCTVDILDEDEETGGSHVGLLALRDIGVGEELSYNYSLSESSLGHEVCCCGAPNCRGVM